ncbi:putative Plant UBX domain-containing protein 4 [Cocos nucifera]|uniref:Putative Plant UBX domain-containing protein 4 n=1 Tax=Cocos nucifera TaxID=13894 RepID=A0A8K0IN08_COCNU|nr:putative Plant UBX domain-containing protein 4 [Cocos nucifera]
MVALQSVIFEGTSRPRAARNYQIQMVGFPPKQHPDEKKMIEEAGLADSVVIQKF